METEDHFVLWALLAGVYVMAGACSVAAIGVVVSVQRLDGRFHWRKLDSHPL